VLILLSTAWATATVSFLPRSLLHNKSNGTMITDSDVIVPGAPSLQFSLDYRATSFHCCEHLTTISRGPIDQFLSSSTSLGRPFKVVARSIPAPIGTGITCLSKDSANHSKSTATTTNVHSQISV